MKVKIIAKFIADFSGRAPKGTHVVIDRWKFTPHSQSGLSFRVVNLYKKPVWFDSGWFE